MGEEVLSPTSPNIQNTPQSRRKRSQGATEPEDTRPRTRRFSVQKSSKADSPRKQSKSPNRTRWPELNVVTNFSKPPILAKRAADADIRTTKDVWANTDDRRRVDKALQRQMNAGTKGNPYHRKDSNVDGQRGRGGEDEINKGSAAYRNAEGMLQDAAGLGLGLPRLDGGRNMIASAQSIKGPINDLKRASSKATELSPSDRLIAIGITVTPTSLADRTMSPEVSQQKSPGLVVQQYGFNRGSPAAPSIVVTPVKATTPWLAPGQQYIAYSPRPASSIYSEATHRGRAATQPTIIPPVPLLSDSSTYPKQRNASEPVINTNQDSSPPRVMSGCTIFEDEDSPPASFRDRAYSGGPQLRLLTRTSTDTIATKHRSHGWWNYLMSPFSARPNAGFSFPKDGPHRIHLGSPHSSEATRIGEDTENASPRKKDEFSPVTTISSGSRSNHTSILTGASGLESERGPVGLAYDHTPRASEIVRKWPREIIGTDLTDLPLSPEGFGAAAEYYRACWHDQNSPTLYFECQRHTCLPSSNTAVADHGALRGERALGGIAEELGGTEGSESNSPEKLKPTVFQQTPANRFSAAFKEEIDRSASKRRPMSEDTVIEDIDDTPAIEEAHAAPVVRAGAPVPAPIAQPRQQSVASSRGLETSPEPPASSIDKADPSARGPSWSPEPQSPPPAAEGHHREAIISLQPRKAAAPELAPLEVEERPLKRFVAIMPPDPPRPSSEQQFSPDPMAPPLRRETAVGHSGTPVVEAAPGNPRPVHIVNHYYGNYHPPPRNEEVTTTDFYPPPRAATLSNEKPTSNTTTEDYPEPSKKSRGCLNLGKRSKAHEPKQKKKKRGLLYAIAVGLILLIVLILALALTLTRKGDNMPVQTQWLNITGFPPMPTGISTIIQPDASRQQSGCVAPTTLWSCALPKEEQESVAPNNIDQPNFRVEIRFQNGTNISMGVNASLTKRSFERAPNAVSASSLVRRHLLQLRDSFSDALFTPTPSPPSLEEQAFLGNSTDKITAPFGGEVTPFFMSFHSAQRLPASRLLKRASGTNSSETNATDAFPDITEGIPPPDVDPDGTAAAAALLPFPSAQPLRLFNRGLPNEHYGFYTYFDRSIFLKSTALVDDNQATGVVPDDEDGGAEESAATVRCTWTQTRFLVQIWTNRGGTASLLASNNASISDADDKNPKNLAASSANDFERPGSFPYPVSITLDRHGGDIKTKMIYCYGLDNRRRVVSDQKKIQLEDRAFGGHLVNPALGPFGNVNVSNSEGGPGGIDGGTGGCSCLWKNWNGADN